jgi:hypothetical protein
MKKRISLSLLFTCLLFTAFYSCKKSTTPTVNSCDQINFQISTTHTDASWNQQDGIITATATGGSGFEFALNNGNFGTSGMFDNLGAGTYIVKGKNSSGCLDQDTVIIAGGTNPCTNTSIVINEAVANAIPCETTPAGSITVTASGSTGFTYNINGGIYQSSNVFSGLSTGSYTIGVKDVNGCSNTKDVTVSNASQGVNFTNVRNIINTSCGGCHLNGASSGGENFDDNCNIVAKWDRINLRCVTQGNMPPSGLSTTQKAQITAWVNAGHKFSD